MDSADPSEPTFPCPVCGRKFIRSSLEKHESACKKLATLHRKPFDSGKQRAKGSDLTYADIKKAQKEKAQNGGVFPRPQTNWRERHGNFIDAVSSSKRVDYALKTGAPLPPPPKTAVPSDYVQCEYCSRNFNAAAAERHIPFCREQASRKQTAGNPKSSAGARALTGNLRSLPSKQDVGRKQTTNNANRNGSSERKPTTRGRDGSLSRSRHEDSNDLNNRRKSLETRSALATAQNAARNTSLSAGMRPTLPPMTPNKRSNSAKRDTQQQQESTRPQRLKTPASTTRSGSRSTSRTRTRDESRESRLSQAKSNSRNNSRSRIF